MATMHKISPCLWFDNQAEDAARFYVSIFEQNSGIDAISRYGKAGFEIHKRPEGSVMTVAFRLAGQPFTALNGGPEFKFSEAISLEVYCDTQQELDYFWSRLSAGGAESVCGWLKDKFGLSWQVIPAMLPDMLLDPDVEKRERVMAALLQMKKLDIASLKRAYEGT